MRNNTGQESVVITGDKPRDMEGSESGAILDSAYHDQEGGGGEPRLPAQDTNLSWGTS